MRREHTSAHARVMTFYPNDPRLPRGWAVAAGRAFLQAASRSVLMVMLPLARPGLPPPRDDKGRSLLRP